MFIHIWMHWFWITAAYLKGFLLFAAHTVSVAEAGLLNYDAYTAPTLHPYNQNDSSQTDPPHLVSTILPPDGTHSPHTMRYLPTAPALQDDPPAQESTPTRPDDDGSSTAFAPASDLADTFNGGPLDAFQYPLKKPSKHAHPKKSESAKIKGKPGDDAPSDAVKVVEEKLNLNITITADGTAPEVDKPDDLPDGDASDIPSTDASDVISTSAAVDNETAEVVPTLKPPQAPPDDHKDLEIPKNDTLVIESKVDDGGSYTTVESFLVKNRVAAATSAHNYEADQSDLNPGSITGITLGILVVFSLFGAVSFVLYRRRYLNKPEVLHDKCSNLDSSGYIDETSLRENSEEMYSLDNDSFLNSLEAMTIQNYWTESVKHTKL